MSRKLRILRANDMMAVHNFFYNRPLQWDLVAVPFVSEKEWSGCFNHSSLCIQRNECTCHRSLYRDYPFCISFSPKHFVKSIERANETNKLLLVDNILIDFNKNILRSVIV